MQNKYIFKYIYIFTQLINCVIENKWLNIKINYKNIKENICLKKYKFISE